MSKNKRDIYVVVGQIANELTESTPRALSEIKRILIHFGQEWCFQRVAEAQTAYTAGSLVCQDGKPRTLGGCFFWFCKEATPKEDRAALFPTWKELREAKKAKAKPIPLNTAKPVSPINLSSLKRTEGIKPQRAYARGNGATLDSSRIFRAEPFEYSEVSSGSNRRSRP